MVVMVRSSVSWQVLSDMRMKINLPGDCRANRRSPRKGLSSSIPSSSAAKDDPAYEILLLDHIKMAALIHKFLALNWLKVCVRLLCVILYVFSGFRMLVFHDISNLLWSDT